MADREPAALWEQALQEQEESTDRLADEIVALAVRWANGNARKLRQAERMLARTRYLEGSE